MNKSLVIRYLNGRG